MRSLSSGVTRLTTTPSRSSECAERLVVGGQVAALDDGGLAAGEPDLPGDRRRRGPVVARDHGDLDPGLAAGRQRVGHARPEVGPRGQRAEQVRSCSTTSASTRPGTPGGRTATASTRSPRPRVAAQRLLRRRARWCSSGSTRPVRPSTRARRRRGRTSVAAGGRTGSGGAVEAARASGVDAEPPGEGVDRGLHGVAGGHPARWRARRCRPSEHAAPPRPARSTRAERHRSADDLGRRVVAGALHGRRPPQASTPRRQPSRSGSGCRSCPCR